MGCAWHSSTRILALMGGGRGVYIACFQFRRIEAFTIMQYIVGFQPDKSVGMFKAFRKLSRCLVSATAHANST